MMAFEDRILTCKECGAEFPFTASEQEFYAEKGFQNDPARCPACRAARSSGGGTASEARPDTSAADGEDPHGTARIIPAAAPGAACTPRHRRKPVPCRGRPAGTDHRGRSHVAGGVRSHAPQPFAQAKATA